MLELVRIGLGLACIQGIVWAFNTAIRYRRTRIRAVKTGSVLTYKSGATGNERSFLVARLDKTDVGTIVAVDENGRRLQLISGGFEIMKHWDISSRTIRVGDTFVYDGQAVVVKHVMMASDPAAVLVEDHKHQIELPRRIRVFRCPVEGSSGR